MKGNDHIVLYDGICTLCGEIVTFIEKKDRKSIFSFIPLDSEAGRVILNRSGLPSEDIESVIYIRGADYLKKSSAVLYILNDLGHLWKLLFAFIIIPVFIRDYIYSMVAKSRFAISCRLNRKTDKHK